jgi:hypothetical protein
MSLRSLRERVRRIEQERRRRNRFAGVTEFLFVVPWGGGPPIKPADVPPGARVVTDYVDLRPEIGRSHAAKDGPIFRLCGSQERITTDPQDHGGRLIESESQNPGHDPHSVRHFCSTL